MSFLDNKFPAIPEDGRINTEQFLLACDSIVRFFDLLGATVFSPVKNDVSGNICKIRKRLNEEEDKEKFRTLNALIETEMAETDKALKIKGTGQGIATNALMWLRRGLRFIAQFFQHLIKEDYVTPKNDLNNLRKCAEMAYDDSLKVYHGWFVTKVFTMAMMAAPYRNKLLQDLAGTDNNNDDEKTMQGIKDFMVVFEQNIENIKELFKTKNVECDHKA